MPSLNKDAGSRENRGRSSKNDEDDEEDVRPAKKPKKNGWAEYARRQEEAEEEKAARASRVPEFWLRTGESSVLQILDAEPYIFDGHNIKDKDDRFTFEPCQMKVQKYCLMCREGLKKNWKPAIKVLDFRGSYDTSKKVFKYDGPVEKIWKMNQTAMGLLIAKMNKKKRTDLLNMVVEVSRTGKGKKDTSYAFEDAFDEHEERIPPMKYKQKYGDTEEALQPKGDDELIKMGFESGDD